MRMCRHLCRPTVAAITLAPHAHLCLWVERHRERPRTLDGCRVRDPLDLRARTRRVDHKAGDLCGGRSGVVKIAEGGVWKGRFDNGRLSGGGVGGGFGGSGAPARRRRRRSREGHVQRTTCGCGWRRLRSDGRYRASATAYPALR
eukprot:3273949-Prymnesium_polylepis.1